MPHRHLQIWVSGVMLVPYFTACLLFRMFSERPCQILLENIEKQYQLFILSATVSTRFHFPSETFHWMSSAFPLCFTMGTYLVGSTAWKGWGFLCRDPVCSAWLYTHTEVNINRLQWRGTGTVHCHFHCEVLQKSRHAFHHEKPPFDLLSHIAEGIFHGLVIHRWQHEVTS